MTDKTSEDHKVLQIGIGVMGTHHANAIKDLSTKEDISLCGVCDSNLDKLISFNQENPNIPVYLVYAPKYQTREEFEAQKEIALSLGVTVIETVAEAVQELDVNTLMNCTNNESHIPVLESALSVIEEEQTKIRTVFQEKPFAHDLEEAEQFTKSIEGKDVSFSLNSILRGAITDY